MNAPPFDTHAAVLALRSTGLDEAQAEAIVNTVRDANTAGREDLATKADIAAHEGRPCQRRQPDAARAGRHRRCIVRRPQAVSLTGY